MEHSLIRIIEEEFSTAGYVRFKGDLLDGCKWLCDIIDPGLKRLGLKRDHTGICVLRIKPWWLNEHYCYWYPGYTAYNVKVELLDDKCMSDFTFEYFADKRVKVETKMTATNERDKVRRKMMVATNWNDIMGLDSWTKFYSDSVVKVDVNKPVKEALPKPEKVIFSGRATIAFWPDGTKTVVKCKIGDFWDQQTGIAMAVLKKLYGTSDSKGNYWKNLVKDIDIVSDEPKKKKKSGIGYVDAKKASKSNWKFPCCCCCPKFINF